MRKAKLNPRLAPLLWWYLLPRYTPEVHPPWTFGERLKAYVRLTVDIVREARER